MRGRLRFWDPGLHSSETLGIFELSLPGLPLALHTHTMRDNRWLLACVGGLALSLTVTSARAANSNKTHEFYRAGGAIVGARPHGSQGPFSLGARTVPLGQSAPRAPQAPPPPPARPAFTTPHAGAPTVGDAVLPHGIQVGTGAPVTPPAARGRTWVDRLVPSWARPHSTASASRSKTSSRSEARPSALAPAAPTRIQRIAAAVFRRPNK
jgi:hypothetical protein